jgi:dolichol-phosphate mannosyltransferase
MGTQLDIVIPVYNEGCNILDTLSALARDVKTPARVLICYDRPEDDTIPAINANPEVHAGLPVEFIRNRGAGPHGAVMTSFAVSRAPFVVMFPADDDYNTQILDHMVALGRQGFDIVCASRFMHAGEMVGCPFFKAVLVRTANFTMFHLARMPTHDSTNGFRLFSRRVIDSIAIESDRGFCFSIELLVKAHRLGWGITEVASRWFVRKHGASRFRILIWLPAYLRWYFYAFATTFLRRSASTVMMKPVRT